MTPKKFKGALAEPIVANYLSPKAVYLPLKSKEEIESVNKQVLQDTFVERLSKIPHLFDHYRIDLEPSNDPSDTRFILLCMAMAEDFVPGFQIAPKSERKRAGRPKRWHLFRQIQLVIEFELAKIECETARKTLWKLISEAPSSERWGPLDVPKSYTSESAQKYIDTLETRLSEARRAVEGKMILEFFRKLSKMDIDTFSSQLEDISRH